MKPTNLRKAKFTHNLTQEQKLALMGRWAVRNGNVPKGTVLAPTQVEACPEVDVTAFPAGWIPDKYFEKPLEHNQQAKHCCRQRENHTIRALKSHPDEKAPDIYILKCKHCGCKHTRFIVAVIDDVPRPIWDAA